MTRFAPSPDVTARALARVGAAVRRLPATGELVPVLAPTGGSLGVGVAGHGVIAHESVRSLGITRRVPYVYDRPAVERARDALARRLGGAEPSGRACLALAALAGAMSGLGPLDGGAFALALVGAITSVQDVLTLRSTRQQTVRYVRQAPNTTIAHPNELQAAWYAFDAVLGCEAPAVPFSGSLAATAPNAAAGGLLHRMAAPGGSLAWYLDALALTLWGTSNVTMLVDVLYECGGIPADSTGPHTLGAAALTRHTDGIGVLPGLVITATVGTGTPVASLQYTNSAGTGSRTLTLSSPGGGGSGTTQLMLAPTPAALESGDVGVRSVQRVTMTTPGGSGQLGCVLYKPLLFVTGRLLLTHTEDDLVAQWRGPIPLHAGTDGELPFLGWVVLPNGIGSGIGFSPTALLSLLRG